MQVILLEKVTNLGNLGDVHRELLTMDLGAEAVFEGFLTQKTLRNERLVFHITKITLNE